MKEIQEINGYDNLAADMFDTKKEKDRKAARRIRRRIGRMKKHMKKQIDKYLEELSLKDVNPF